MNNDVSIEIQDHQVSLFQIQTSLLELEVKCSESRTLNERNLQKMQFTLLYGIT